MSKYPNETKMQGKTYSDWRTCPKHWCIILDQEMELDCDYHGQWNTCTWWPAPSRCRVDFKPPPTDFLERVMESKKYVLPE